MTRNAAREARRETLEDLIGALKAIGARGLTGAAADAFARANQCVGRFQGIDELEVHQEQCECGRRAPFPRPIIETIDPDACGGRQCVIPDCAGIVEPGTLYCEHHRHPDVFAGVEIDPLLTPSQVEAAWHAARETELEEAAEAFESSEETLDELCDALDRAAANGGAS